MFRGLIKLHNNLLQLLYKNIKIHVSHHHADQTANVKKLMVKRFALVCLVIKVVLLDVALNV